MIRCGDVPADAQRRLGVPLDLHAALASLLGLDGQDGRRLAAGGDRAEVRADPRLGLVDIDVPDDGEDGVVRSVEVLVVACHASSRPRVARSER